MNKQLLMLGMLAASVVALPAIAKLPPPGDEANAKKEGKAAAPAEKTAPCADPGAFVYVPPAPVAAGAVPTPGAAVAAAAAPAPAAAAAPKK